MFLKLYMTAMSDDTKLAKAWFEDEKDLYLSYQMGERIAADILTNSNENQFKHIANEIYGVLLTTFDMYYEVYYCRSSEFIKREAFPVLRELVSSLQDVCNTMIEYKIVKKEFIPNFVFNCENLESQNVDFRRIAGLCHSLLFELQKFEVNRIFMC